MGIVAWTFTKSDIWLRLTRSATAVYPTADSPAGCTTGTLCISRLREMFTLEMDPRTPLLDPRSSTGQVGRSCLLDPLLLLPHFMSLQKERLDLPFVAASRQFPIPQRPASVTAALWSAWSSYPQTTHLKLCWVRRLARSTSCQRRHSWEEYAARTVWAAIPCLAAAQASCSGICPSWEAYRYAFMERAWKRMEASTLILINESGIRMILDQFIDRPVDLLLDMTAQAL